MKEVIRIQIDDPSGVGEARRLVMPICKALDFSETDIGNVSLIVTEMATNLSKHAKCGVLLIRSLECRGIRGLEMLSVDKGTGMANIGRCMIDGYSTSGSPGTGLGAIYRISSEFDIYSEKAKGTVLMSRYWLSVTRKRLPERPLAVGAVCLPISGEDVCGDAWAVEQTSQKSLVFVSDGIGHGIEAAEASGEAVSIFRKNRNESPALIIEALHAGLRGTRGTAVAVAEIDHINNIVKYAGIGNIAGKIVANSIARNMVSHNGTAGYEAHKIQEFIYQWGDESLLIMNSDGLTTGLSLVNYPMLASRHPSVIAAVLYRDFVRGRDDATIVVAKKMGEKIRLPCRG